MGVSLEARVPILGHHIVKCAWSLSVAMKIRHGQGKWILRKLLGRHVPCDLIDQSKMGFGVPIDSWSCGFLLE